MPSKPPFHRQETRYSCVPACLRMVLAALGVETAEPQLRGLCDSNFKGTDAFQAVEAARKLGFTRSAKHTLNENELRDVLATGCFPIVFISLLPLDALLEIHAVVVIEMTDQVVIVLDPLKGERRLSLEIFNTAWAMGLHLAILIER